GRNESYRLDPPCSIVAKWNPAVFAISCIASLCIGRSLFGIAGTLTRLTICGKVSPKSGFPSLRYRVYQLVSTVRFIRFVSLFALLFAPVAWLLGNVRNASRLTAFAPLDFK